MKMLFTPGQLKFTLSLSVSSQIMIEFCPGGAVDATMLGESLSVLFISLHLHEVCVCPSFIGPMKKTKTSQNLIDEVQL